MKEMFMGRTRVMFIPIDGSSHIRVTNDYHLHVPYLLNGPFIEEATNPDHQELRRGEITDEEFQQIKTAAELLPHIFETWTKVQVALQPLVLVRL